jgi:hypothetical protein
VVCYATVSFSANHVWGSMWCVVSQILGRVLFDKTPSPSYSMAVLISIFGFNFDCILFHCTPGNVCMCSVYIAVYFTAHQGMCVRVQYILQFLSLHTRECVYVFSIYCSFFHCTPGNVWMCSVYIYLLSFWFTNVWCQMTAEWTSWKN